MKRKPTYILAGRIAKQIAFLWPFSLEIRAINEGSSWTKRRQAAIYVCIYLCPINKVCKLTCFFFASQVWLFYVCKGDYTKQKPVKLLSPVEMNGPSKKLHI